jgi:hypothetical protein
MFVERKLPRGAIPTALAKAERYRLLNEPDQAESICRDIIAVEPGLEEALICLLLSITDQFPRRPIGDAKEVAARLRSEYDRAYYGGLILERWGKSQIDRVPGNVTYHLIHDALREYERALQLAGEDTPDAILRWNFCVRLLASRPELAPKASDEPGGEGYGWDEPPSAPVPSKATR